MKITEIIVEGVPSKLRKSTMASTPGMQTWPELDNGNVPYLQYRFGIAMAGSPDMEVTNHGPVGGNLTTIAFSSADQEILDGAAKIMGVIPKNRSSKKSIEVASVYKQSPVQARGPIALKKKK